MAKLVTSPPTIGAAFPEFLDREVEEQPPDPEARERIGEVHGRRTCCSPASNTL